jgi:hypothetical protein
MHTKPCALLDVEGYWSGLTRFLDHATGEGFLRAAHREMLLTAPDPDALLAAFAAYEAPQLPKWVDRAQA